VSIPLTFFFFFFPSYSQQKTNEELLLTKEALLQGLGRAPRKVSKEEKARQVKKLQMECNDLMLLLGEFILDYFPLPEQQTERPKASISAQLLFFHPMLCLTSFLNSQKRKRREEGGVVYVGLQEFLQDLLFLWDKKSGEEQYLDLDRNKKEDSDTEEEDGSEERNDVGGVQYSPAFTEMLLRIGLIQTHPESPNLVRLAL
jgi:hypothetical protein